MPLVLPEDVNDWKKKLMEIEINSQNWGKETALSALSWLKRPKLK